MKMMTDEVFESEHANDLPLIYTTVLQQPW